MSKINKDNLGYLGLDFQYRLLLQIITDRKFGTAILDMVNPNYFEDSYVRIIVGTIKDAFEKHVANTIHPDLLIPEISVDAELHLTEINERLIRILNQFEPFGPQNMTPVFMTKNLNDSGYAKTLGKNNEHLKLFVKQNNSEGFGTIGFGLAAKLDLVKNQNSFDAVYCIDENEYNGTVTVQLRLKDLR